jgi:peptidoglycan/xylan/chitin deacetylase (PgdA/CDA1 family)
MSIQKLDRKLKKKSDNYFSLSWNIKDLGLAIVFLSYLFSIVNFAIEINSATASLPNKNHCNCVIFRLDDIRNGYLEVPQLSLLNIFISNNDSISLGIILNEIHDETNIYQKIKEGYTKGLFELGVHGWDHVDYTKLTENEQSLSMLKANQKMYSLFGNYSNLFIPPFNLFNNDTISAMRNKFNIISSANYYDHPDIQSSFNNISSENRIFHMPEMTEFSIYYNGTWVKSPVKFLLSDIDFDIKTYGYSVIMVHPHNFAIQINGSLTNNVDYDQMKILNSLIKAIKEKNIQIMTFSEATAIK